MGTASKQPTKKEVRVAPRKTSRCPCCNKIIETEKLSKHIGSGECR